MFNGDFVRCLLVSLTLDLNISQPMAKLWAKKYSGLSLSDWSSGLFAPEMTPLSQLPKHCHSCLSSQS